VGILLPGQKILYINKILIVRLSNKDNNPWPLLDQEVSLDITRLHCVPQCSPNMWAPVPYVWPVMQFANQAGLYQYQETQSEYCHSTGIFAQHQSMQILYHVVLRWCKIPNRFVTIEALDKQIIKLSKP